MSRKKRKKREIDSEQDTNFEEKQEEGIEKKGISGKVSRNKGKNIERDYVPSDDEILIKRLERKRKNVLAQDLDADKGFKKVEFDRNKQGGNEDYPIHNKDEEDHGFLKGIFGNLGLMKKDISNLK